MVKAWEETWTAARDSARSHHVIVLHGSGEIVGTFGVGPGCEATAALAAEAPAMWRLLAESEITKGYEGGDCVSCAECLVAGAKTHAPDCEWLRIAKAIGYR